MPSIEKGAQTMRAYITETPADPLACPHCGCSDLLCGIPLGEVLAATICRREAAARPDEQHDRPLWDTAPWLERAAIICRSCTPVELSFDELVPAALPPVRPEAEGAGS
jgi:hypothetical protein